MVVIPSSRWIRITSSTVFERVDPPAPIVTETKPGFSSFSSSIVRKSERKPASVFGGKNSKETTGSPRP